MGHHASATREVAAPVCAVLDVALTVEDMVRWFPVPVEAIEAPDHRPLRAGDSCVAEAPFAGRRLQARIDVLEASASSYRLVASGPVCFTVTATLVETADGCRIDADVEARSGGGIAGRLLEGACRPLLGAGLRQALERIARLAEMRGAPLEAIAETETGGHEPVGSGTFDAEGR